MKRLIITCIVLLLVGGVAFAADQNLTAKTADTSPTSDDIIYVVDDPGGTAADRKVTLANLAANMPDITVGNLTVSTAMSVGGAGTEGVITMPDSAATDHDLTIGTDDKIYIDGAEYASGATTSASGVTYVTSATDDFAVGGTDSDSPLFFDESTGALNLNEGNAVINFIDVTEYAEIQVDGTKVMELTTSGIDFAVDVQGYAFLTLSSSDTTNIDAGDAPAFLENDANLSVTGNQVQLLSGKTYLCTSTIRCEFGGVGYINLGFYDVGNSEYLTPYTQSFTPTWTENDSNVNLLQTVYTPSSDTTVQLRIQEEQALTESRHEFSSVIIREIA